ncbi:hypothetical protein F5Y16DRAFT_388200 [Xylariaceae sp. FL0255]|nr:hypothetical protein F5Y16DRAFT_388200 [Xylariaceae sp. FL0255]
MADTYCLPSLTSQPKSDVHRGVEGMPIASIDPHPNTVPLNIMSTEILILVVTRLDGIDQRSVARIRLLSTRFNKIATPIRYHTLHLTRDIIDHRSELAFPRGLANIHEYTKHVIAESNLNPERVRHLLSRIQNLLSVRWRYLNNDLRKGSFWVPADILNSRHIQNNPIQLHIENLPLIDFRGEQRNPYLKAIPAGTLITLQMATPTPPLTAQLDTLKGLLLKSIRLENFSYSDRGQGTRFAFSPGERLPAFKHLALRSYDWDHSSEEVYRHWDFSDIRGLELVDVPIQPFLASITFSDFRYVESLRLDDFSTHRAANLRKPATRGQYILVKQIRALQDLSIACDIASFPVDGILCHAQSLRRLRFRDYVGFGDEFRRCPTLNIEDLDILSQHLVQLRTLELDMDEALCDALRFLETLCNFPLIHTLILHTQTVIDVFKPVEPGSDPDRDRAKQIFALLMSRGRLGGGVSWRSITLNVGGWKKPMVRRLASVWREQNSHGVYAERCFVLERNDGGEMVMREEST